MGHVRRPPPGTEADVTTATVLLVEDEDAIRELTAFHLRRAGFAVVEAATAEAGWARLAEADVLVLDWMLPDESGLVFLRRLRANAGQALPVLMLTARARQADRVEGLETGADDYLVKPFGATELIARLRALLRRTSPRRRLVVAGLRVDLEAAEVTLDGLKLELTRREFELLAFLLAHAGRVFSRTQLLDHVWGDGFVGTERTVDQHVAQLRAHIGPAWIETVRGRGYRWSEAVAGKPDA